MILSTKRLILREFQQDDYRTTLEYQSHPHFSNYYPWESRTYSEVCILLDQFIQWSKEHPRSKFQLAITLKNEEKLIGNCGIRKEIPESTKAEFGCELDPFYWNQGYAIEAGRALLDFGFRNLNLVKVFSICVAKNHSALHLLERLGMKHDENWKNDQWMKGCAWEMRKYSLNKKSFQAFND